jgi:molybdopterin converting factor small subunit
MRIEFFGPFRRLIGSEIYLELKEPVTLGELIHLLASQYPTLPRGWERSNDAELSAHVMFVKDGRPLKLMDSVEDRDVLQVLVPVTGG